jgi:hypothetical protein
MRTQLDELRHLVTIVNRIQSGLTANLPLISRGGCPSWPTATQGSPAAKRKTALQTQLSVDYAQVLARCDSLRHEADAAVAALVSLGQLCAAEESLNEAVAVRRLTLMALVFVPLTFAASVFQMDYDAWQNPPAVRAFMSSAICTSAVTLLVLYWGWCMRGLQWLMGLGMGWLARRGVKGLKEEV